MPSLKGNGAAALEHMKREPSEHWRLLGLTLAYHALELDSESDATLIELIQKYERTMSWNIAYAHALRNDSNRAFEWLEKAVQYRDAGLGGTAVHPMFASLHADPRWLPFLRELGMAPEQLAAIKFDVKLPQ